MSISCVLIRTVMKLLPSKPLFSSILYEYRSWCRKHKAISSALGRRFPHTDICPANHVHCAKIGLLKDRVLENFFWKVYAQDIRDHTKTNANGAVLTAEMDVFLEFKNLSMVAQSSLLNNGIDVRVIMLEKTAECSWFDRRNEARSEALRLRSDVISRQSHSLTHSAVIWASFDPSDRVGSRIACKKMSPV